MFSYAYNGIVSGLSHLAYVFLCIKWDSVRVISFGLCFLMHIMGLCQALLIKHYFFVCIE